MAVSANTVTLPGCTSRMPPATKMFSSPSSARTILTVPGRMREISGVWPGRMPSSPASPGSTTNFASPVKIASSALTTSTCRVAISDPYWSFLAFSKASSIVPTM
ncbi:Uncharacterised protein [Bordetella pertussis]|nr:Uncharacterised protein [Bordetella pertussis]